MNKDMNVIRLNYVEEFSLTIIGMNLSRFLGEKLDMPYRMTEDLQNEYLAACQFEFL